MSEQQVSGWSPGPRGPRACAGVVEVWRADLTAAPDELQELLCSEERERAQRIVRAGARTLWTHSRGLLRALLGRYLERDPRQLRFEVGAHGKPKLAHDGPAADNGPAGPDLRFNLSHSGPLVLVAVSARHEVGVDVEHARTRDGAGTDELALAARVFGTAQARRLAELDRDQRAGELLRAWAMHEATLKCLGTGLAGTGRTAPDPREGLWRAALDVGPGAAAAVAAQGEQARELRCWDWQT
jgi:4'-phosphopantetheinyl transferase